jgi:hypothetical protein
MVRVARWKCQLILNPIIEQVFLSGRIDPQKIAEDAVRQEAARIASIDRFNEDVAQALIAQHEARNG